MRQPWFEAVHEDGSDATQELLSFSSASGLETAAPNRYSLLLLMQLYATAKADALSPTPVIAAVRELEGLEQRKGLKPPTQFKHPPLKGLWHQHYLETSLRSMAINIRKGLNSFGSPFFNQKIKEARGTGEESYFTKADVALLADDVVSGNWERLMSNNALTGEWLIYATHDSKNYYLCIAAHDDGDHVIRSRIDALPAQEFPFLRSILTD